MHKKYNKFLIVSFIVVAILGVYSYFYNDLVSEAAQTNNSISSSLDDNDNNKTGINNKVSEDVSFLMKLVSLKNISIDTSLFENKGFNLLVDNNIKLDPVPYGRINPFSPIENYTTFNQGTSVLKTNPASAILNKSAVLNGSLSGNTSNNIYFEYGTKQTLGSVSNKVNPSLVGIFSIKIEELKEKTTYFYRSVANINGSIIFGEVISFTTN